MRAAGLRGARCRGARSPLPVTARRKVPSGGSPASSGAYTPKQRAILQFIADYRRDHGVSPTLEEIGGEFGVHRVTIFQHVNALEQRGAIRRTAQLARSIEIIDPGFQVNPGVPILGRIAAGRPIEAVEVDD